MAKMTPAAGGVTSFIASVDDPAKRADCKKLMRIMREVTGHRPKLWGSSIVGYGTYHYRYASGREGDWFLTGFSPRKASLSLYLTPGLESQRPLLDRLGPHTTGTGCLYVKRVADVDLDVLRELVEASVARAREMDAS